MGWEFGFLGALTKTVSFVLLGTRYRLPLWEFCLLAGFIGFLITTLISRGTAPRGTILFLFMSGWKGSFPRLVITAPIIEEIIFRFVLITFLLGFTGSAALAILISSLLFGFLHIHWGAYRVFDTFLGGVLLGIVFVNFGLLAAILSHMTANFFVFTTGGYS